MFVVLVSQDFNVAEVYWLYLKKWLKRFIEKRDKKQFTKWL